MTANFSPDAYLASLYNNAYAAPFTAVNTAAQAELAAAQVRENLRQLLKLDSLHGRVAQLQPVVLHTKKRQGYTEEKISVEICSSWHMLVYLLRPDQPNDWGVAALCGHGTGVREIIGLSQPNYQKNFAVELAQRGCTVVAPEFIAFGEARLHGDAHENSCYTVTAALHLCGTSTAALRVYQAQRCLDLLAAQAGVDPSKLGCMGISGGGLVALMLACADERGSAAVVSGYVNTLRASVLASHHCADNYIHGLLCVGEPYDLAAAIAPRCLCIESGTKDEIFPINGAQQAHDEIRRVYTLLGAQDNLCIDVFDRGHEISGKHSFDFFL